MYTVAGKADGSDFADLCEKAYNARAAVPDYPKIGEKWIGEAAAYRETAECALDIAYLESHAGGSVRTLLDIFWPTNTDRQNCPIAVFIHGGYWQAQDRKSFSHMANGLNQRGVALFMPSYDLCPDTNVGAITDQMAAACTWIWRNYGRRIAVGGHSAGGHLTGAMMARDFAASGAPSNLVTNGLPISGLFDLRDLVATSINDKVGMTVETATAWSPLLGDAPTSGTLQAWVGGDESEAFHWQSKQLVKRWKKSGLQTKYHSAKGKNHFTVIEALSDPDSKMTKQFADMAVIARDES